MLAHQYVYNYNPNNSKNRWNVLTGSSAMLTQHIIYHQDQKLIGMPGVITHTQMGVDLDHPQFRLAVEIDKQDGTQAFIQMVSVPAENATENLQLAVLGILKAAHVVSWEQLSGKQVIALYADDQAGVLGYIKGICDADGENIFLALPVAVKR